MAFATSSAAPPPRPITASAPCALYAAAPSVDLAADRIAPDFRVHGDVEARQVGDERLQQRQRRDAAVGDDQRPANAVFGEMRGTSLRAPAPKWMVVGKLKREMVMVAVRKRIMWILADRYRSPTRMARGSTPNERNPARS